MRPSKLWHAVVLLAVSPMLIAASGTARKVPAATAEAPPVARPAVQLQPGLAPVNQPEADVVASPDAATEPAAYQLNWYSINSGGVINAASTNYRMGLSVGQSVAGEAASPSYNLGVGFWYGAGSQSGGCPITMTGDVNVTGSITSGDIIYLVNFVFKTGPVPVPCEAAGDVNCSGSLTSADIIYLVNFVFKAGPDPCDGCTSSLAGDC